MGPVLEDRLVHGLRPPEMLAPVSRDARIENVVMAALDHVDGVDLHVAQVLHRRAGRFRTIAERLVLVEPPGAQPDSLGVGGGNRKGWWGASGHEWPKVYR